MENASKALLIAGGIFLTMLVVSLLVYGWNTFSEYQAELDRLEEIENVAKFNGQFANYNREDVQGYELLSLVNKVIDYNQRKAETGANSDSAAGNIDSYPAITVNIELYNGTTGLTEKDVAEKLTRTVTIPAYTGRSEQKIGNNEKLTLFTDDDYTQSDTDKQFEKEILKEVLEMEVLNSEFGGATGIQNLVKNIDTIYQGEIIGYNTGNVDYSWYDESYIIARYKTLTGKQCTITEIRDESRVRDVLKYYEYSNFKKAIFECTGIDYDDGETNPDGTVESTTGRIIGMDFKFTGELM